VVRKKTEKGIFRRGRIGTSFAVEGYRRKELSPGLANDRLQVGRQECECILNFSKLESEP